MPAVPVCFFCEKISFTPRNKKKLKNWIADTAKKEGFAIGNINYIFCNDEYLYQINKKFLNHDTYTDIVTFDNNDSESEKLLIADIFISYERLKENAKLFGVSLTNELHRVMIHGILHLCGYKDKKKADSDLMRKKEDNYVASLHKKFNI